MSNAVNIVYAWLSIAMGYLFCRTIPVHNHPFGAFLFIFAIFTFATVFMIVKKAKQTALSIIAMVSALAMSLSILFSANGFLQTLAFIYALAAFAYYVYRAFGNTIADGFCDFISWDFIKAMFIMPFCAIDEFFKTLTSTKTKGGAKAILKLAFGFLVAIIPTAIIVALLSYDSGFSELMGSVFSIRAIFSHIFSAIFGLPFAVCIYSLLLCSHEKRTDNIITAPNISKVTAVLKVFPALCALGAVIPIVFVYVVFFISQWKYYVSAFAGKIPANISIAEYARQGFFELCGVSVINLFIIIVLAIIIRGKTIKRILSTVLSLFTLVLIATAISKMVLYIDRYGLTHMRVYPLWFMVVLAVVFIIILIKQFYRRLPSVALSMAVTVVLFTALSVCNIDGIIANYNVSRYLEGTLDEVDMYSLEHIGDAAVPALCRLENTRYQDAARAAIAQIEKRRDDSIWSFTIPREIAKSSQK